MGLLKNQNAIFMRPYSRIAITDGFSRCGILKPIDEVASYFSHLEGKVVPISLLRKTDIRLFFTHPSEVCDGTNIACKVIDKAKAWISEYNGEYRYFSRRKDGVIFAFDVIDLLQVSEDMKFREVISYFRDNFNISIYNDNLDEETEKYKRNIKIAKSASFLESDIMKFCNAKRDIYIEINKIGLENLQSESLNRLDNATFFTSYKFIRKRLNNKYSLSTITKVVNALSVMGLIQKISFDNIPLEFKSSFDFVKKFDSISNYYLVPNLEEEMDDANRVAKSLIENNEKYHTLTRDKVSSIVGAKRKSEVYDIQKTYSGKTYKPSEHDLLNDIFLNIYKNNNYVSKEMFIESSPKNFSKSYLNNKFLELVGENKLWIVKPNKRLKEKLKLKKSSNIAIKYGVV